MRYRISGPYALKILIGLVLAVTLASAGSAFGGGAAESSGRPSSWAKPVPSAVLPNWYRLDDGVYRSRQPDRKGFEEAKKKGIRTIINLRSGHSDAKLIQGLGLNLVEIPMNAGSFTEDHILRALKAIQSSPKPVLIHCEHGADRAGAVSAAYRVVVQGWSKDEAIAELRKGGFGFHWIYLNIPAFIKDMDVAAFRARLAAAKPSPQPEAQSSLSR
jgi:tyrosine-protein phosphatase SIW14